MQQQNVGLEFGAGVWMHLGMVECHVPFSGHFDLDIWPRIFVSRTYLLYYLRWEFQIWCVDASWNGRVSSTIYRSL